LAWFGSVWLGLAWFGLVPLGLACFGLVWLGLAWFGSGWLGLARVGLVRLGLAWFGLLQHEFKGKSTSENESFSRTTVFYSTFGLFHLQLLLAPRLLQHES
jgi:hypothetical protein